MTKDEAITLLRLNADQLRARGVARLALVGSVARGEARPDSDVDVLVAIAPGRRFSLLDHSGLRIALCDLLRRDTDVLVEGALDPSVLSRVRRDAVSVF